MKKLYTFLFLSGFYASFCQTTFQKTYGVGQGQSIQITNDKGFILLGSAEGQVGLMSACKTDSLGVIQWSSSFGSNPNFVYGYSVQQTTDSGYIFAGNMLYASNQSDNIVLVKTNAHGVIQWHKFYNYFGSIARGFSVQQTNDGGYILVGQNYANSLILKTDAAGNMQWTKSITNMAIAKCIQKTSNGGFVIAGYGNAPSGTAGFDFSLLKIDSSGNLLWSKTFGGANKDLANSVKKTTDGGYILVGTTLSYGAGGEDIYLVKTDSMGNLKWAKTFGDTLSEEGNDVIQTADGGFAIAGTTNSYGVANSYDAYLIKTDALGALQWSKTFGSAGDEMAASLVQTHNGGFALFAYTTSSFALYNKPNMYLIKTDANGNSPCYQTTPITKQDTGCVQGLGSPACVADTTGQISTNLSFQNDPGSQATLVCTSVDINQLTHNTQLNIYPNPAQNKVIIDTNDVTDVKLFDVLGKQIISTKENQMDVSNLPNGVYFIQVQTKQNTTTQKIIVQH